MLARVQCLTLSLFLTVPVYTLIHVGLAPAARAQADEDPLDEIGSPEEAAEGFGIEEDFGEEEAASALEDSDPAAEAAAEELEAGALGGVERITVTATKREESFQDVPISMSALDSSFIEESGLTDFTGIQKFVPNMSISGGTDTRSTTIRIRGIGSTGTNAGIDPSVGLFIDGIYQGRAGMSMSDLVDIERVEVLRGPQGTLYGKNTAAGLVHIITKRPDHQDYSVFAEGIFGTYNDFQGRTAVNIPIIDETLATRFSFYRSVRGGWDTNLFTGEEVNDSDKWGLRSKVLWDINENVSLLLSGDYAEEKSKCCVPDIITYDGNSLLWAGRNFQDPNAPEPTYNTNRNFAKMNGFFNLPLPGDSPANPNGNFTGRYISPFERKPFLRNFEPFDGQVDVDISPQNDVSVWGAPARQCVAASRRAQAHGLILTR